MHIVEFSANSLRFLESIPDQMPQTGFVWIYLERHTLGEHIEPLQQAALRLGGSMMLEEHLKDLQNAQHPSRYDFTSIYDLIVFRRLAAPSEMRSDGLQEGSADGYQSLPTIHHSQGAHAPVIRRIESRAVAFAVFDRLLITTHPEHCGAARSFVQRFLADVESAVDAVGARNRIPISPADLTLRMLNVMVDGYLDLRKDLSTQLAHWQTQLLKNSARFNDWLALMDARHQLHVLEDLCDEQHDALQEWLDSIQETPAAAGAHDAVLAQLQRDQLIARARDVMEHIARVMHHARRLEQSAETAVQIHFSAQSHRANESMRTLTALTAIFLPLNLIAGIFGMNFEFLPFIHSNSGFWWALGAMGIISITLAALFWRKKYLDRSLLERSP